MAEALPPLVIRADATAAMGTGHVMRMIALAQAWQDASTTLPGSHITFVCRDLPAVLEERLVMEGFLVSRLAPSCDSASDLRQTAEIAQRAGASWVVIDGYHFDGSYASGLRERSLRVVLMDDFGHTDGYPCDLLINQNICASSALYLARLCGTRLLLGCRFALLRREFRRHRGWHRDVRTVPAKGLITLGGSDPHNVTSRMVAALAHSNMPPLAWTVVVGAANTHVTEIKAAALHTEGIRLAASVTDMAALMRDADVAIAAGGTTTHELAFMGLPMALAVLAGNQAGIVAGLVRAGAARSIGETGTFDPDAAMKNVSELVGDLAARAAMAGIGQALVDGWGTERIIACMEPDVLALRRAELGDCDLYWKWLNDPLVIQVSFSAPPASIDIYRSWFASQLARTGNRLYVLLGPSGDPIGQVRFESKGDEAVVSTSIDERFRGCALAAPMIRRASSRFEKECRPQRIHAYIRETNKASLRAFEAAGYCRIGLEVHEGTSAWHLAREAILSAPGAIDAKKIDILCSSQQHRVWPYLETWRAKQSVAHDVHLISTVGQAVGGDLLFLISCGEVVPATTRALYRATMVLHASDLPEGRGWSPHIWQILEGRKRITVSLFEAADKIDTGPILGQEEIELAGHELCDEINAKLFESELRLLDFAIANFGSLSPRVQAESTKPHYRKRTPADSRLDPDKSIAEQFDLLRVSDVDLYPAFFDHRGHRYIVQLKKIRKTED